MLVLITAFSFIACDGDPTPGPDPDPDPDPTPDPVPTDTLPENVSGTLDIYISLNEDEAAAYQMVADEYTYLQKEKGNTVKVNINNNSTADSYQKEVEALISMGVSNATIAKTGVDLLLRDGQHCRSLFLSLAEKSVRRQSGVERRA